MATKEKIIQELEARFYQERKSKEEELAIAISKYDNLHSEMVEAESQF